MSSRAAILRSTVMITCVTRRLLAMYINDRLHTSDLYNHHITNIQGATKNVPQLKQVT